MQRAACVAALLCLAALAAAQTCELWAGEPAECGAFLNGTIVFVNGNQSDIAALIAPQASLLASQIAPAAPACFVRLMPLLCRSAFPACTQVDVPPVGTVTLWTAQCRTACEDANLACNPVFLAAGQAPQDCTQSVPGSPLPLFPDGDLVVPLAPGLNASVPCQPSPPFECPTTKDGVTLKRVPLDRRNETNGFSCWDCPVPVFASPDQYRALWWGTAIIGGIGILLCIWTIVPILIDRQRRTYPSICTVYLTIAALMVDTTFVMTAIVGWKSTYCEEPWLPARYKHAQCVVQGLFIYMTTMWLLIWSSVIIFNVWYIVIMEHKPSRALYNWQLGLGWGVPIFFGFLAGVLRQYSYDGFAYCFISDTWPPYSSDRLLRPWIGMVFWYWPFAVMLVVNTGLILHVVIKCIKTGVAGIFTQWRTIAYFVFYAYTCGFAIVMWIRAEATRQETADSAAGYIGCLFFSLDSRACVPAPGYPPVNAGVALFLTLACTSLWCFLSFGTSPDHVKCWLNLPGAIRKGDWSFESLQYASSSLHGSASGQPGGGRSGGSGESAYSTSPRGSGFRI